MILVIGRVTSDPTKRDELVRVSQVLAQASRQEDGCIGYRFYADTEREHDYVFVEEWVSRDALREHFATPHVADFMGAISGLIVGAPDVGFHDVAATMDLAQAIAATQTP
jgi:quinol monooxygenase YgiN